MSAVKERSCTGPAVEEAVPRLAASASAAVGDQGSLGAGALFPASAIVPGQAQHKGRAWRYGLAVLAVAVAAALRHLITFYFGPAPVYIIFYPAVMLAALLAGPGPGLLATALSGLWILTFLQPPSALAAGHLGEAIGFGLFLVMGAVISAFSHRLEQNRRKTLEAVLSQARYSRALIEASLDPLVTISPGGKITDVNRATELVTGVNRENLIGADFAAYFTEPEKAHAGYREAFERGQVTDYGLSIRHASGKITDVLYNARVYRDERGEVAGVFAAARDVTERKRAEEDLRASEEHYRGFIERNPAGVVRSTVQGKVLLCNEAFVRMLGYGSRQEVMETPARDFYLRPQDREALLTLLRQQSFISNYELCFKRKDGAPVWILCSIGLVREAQGAVIESTAVDITERKRVEAELAQHRQHLEDLVGERTADLEASNRLLEASNKELETFAYSISHDLRAPLRAVDGFSRLLLEEYGDKFDDEGRRMLQLVRHGSQKLAQLIEDILAFSRVGRQEMAWDRMDMNELVRAVREDLEPATAGREIEWDIQALPEACGDARLLRRLWMNLLDNAVKFTRAKTPARIQVGAEAGQQETVYFVRDNGVGFEMQYAHKLFGLFQRLHGEGEFTGTGIGLAVVQRIVARHGGRVWAESKVGQGATFYFAIPRKEGKHESESVRIRDERP